MINLISRALVTTVLFLTALLSGATLLVKYDDMRALQAEGQLGIGLIEELQFSVCGSRNHCKRPRQNYRITYSFDTLDGVTIRRTKVVDTNKLPRMTRGMTMPVAYLASQPERNWITPHNAGPAAVKTMLLFWLIASALAIFSLGQLRRAMDIVSDNRQEN